MDTIIHEIEQYEDGVLDAENNIEHFDDDREVILEKIMHYPAFKNFHTQLSHVDFTQYYSCVRGDVAKCLDLLMKNKRPLEKSMARLQQPSSEKSKRRTSSSSSSHPHHTTSLSQSQLQKAPTPLIVADESDDGDYAGLY